MNKILATLITSLFAAGVFAQAAAPAKPATPAVAAKPEGELQRRPRSRRPSNGGKGYVARS